MSAPVRRGVRRYLQRQAPRHQDAPGAPPQRPAHSDRSSRWTRESPGASLHHLQIDVEGRRREQQRVDAIEYAAVSGYERRAVLHAGSALETRLEQVSTDPQYDDRDTQEHQAGD